ncbi:MAG: DUF1735 domain-containing protein [Deltaproteobacteria bacterium]|nr:DUF1735 domain-containing protein [Deltaproteobacteria bacterium]
MTVTTTNAQITLHVPGFSWVNQFSLPAGIPSDLGDVLFSSDGNTLFILGGSESFDSGVWSVPVTRDASGAVVGLGTATLLFLSESMDTGLEFKPGTGTLFFRNDLASVVGERRTDGTIAFFPAEGSTSFGGLAFVPDPLPNAGDMLLGDWDTGEINIHSLTDNGDGFFTPGPKVFYSNSELGATGDLQFIPTGTFANDLMFTNFSNGTVSIIDIDPITGLPVGGGSTPSITLFASGLGSGPWGLDFDPITGNLFIANFGGNPPNGIVQISGFPPPIQPPEADPDRDGIFDEVDTHPIFFSNDFSDGTTTGTITNRGDQILTITDSTDPSPNDGVSIAADLSGGAAPASVSACGGTAILSLDAGEEAVVTCGSVTIGVISGIVDITFVDAEGNTAAVSLTQDNNITFESETFSITASSTNTDPVVITFEASDDTQVTTSLTADNSVSLDTTTLTFTAPSTNTDAVAITFEASDGTQATTILTTDESLTFEPETFTITNDGPEPVTVEVNGEPIVIATNETIDIDVKTVLCHKGKTKSVSGKSLAKHLAHDDTLGACTGNSQNNEDKTKKEIDKAIAKVEKARAKVDKARAKVDSASQDKVEKLTGKLCATIDKTISKLSKKGITDVPGPITEIQGVYCST